jgi:hypothetical protein
VLPYASCRVRGPIVTEHTICKLAQSCEEMPGSPDHCQTHRCNMEFPCRDALLLVIGDLKHDYDRLAAHENALHQIIEQAEARETALREALEEMLCEVHKRSPKSKRHSAWFSPGTVGARLCEIARRALSGEGRPE